MGLFYSKILEPQFFGYADAGYLSNPHKARSRIRYIFTYGNTAISWRLVKQTMVATSPNHSEILAMHEASRECVWLRSMIQHIRKSCGLSSITNKPTILSEDNATSQKEDILKIWTIDNIANLFIEALPTTTFVKLVYQIGMR